MLPPLHIVLLLVLVILEKMPVLAREARVLARVGSTAPTANQLLEEMSTREIEILENKDYLAKYYPLIDRIYNEGCMTLASPKVAELGHEVLVGLILLRKQTLNSSREERMNIM